MRRIIQPKFRYGEADWDKDYMKWVCTTVRPRYRKRSRFCGCFAAQGPCTSSTWPVGPAFTPVHWARSGHKVTAVDLSETFVAAGRKLAEAEGWTLPSR